MKNQVRSNSALRFLPSVDAIVRGSETREVQKTLGASRLTNIARSVVEEMRAEMTDGGKTPQTFAASREALLAEAIDRLKRRAAREMSPGVRRVINASGVILHTNLGRSPLAESARRRIAHEAAGYCALEYDLAEGARGRRGERAENLLAELTGAEAALVVNNCAAAALLILSTLARDGETIVSRGELVEIGGDFRVPDVMAQSGTRLIEVGTTNRTRLTDYEARINESTRLIMRVHPSNYRIVGFTAAPTLAELSGLARAAGLPFYEDAGSGALVDLSPYGLADEPVVGRSVAAGVDLVSFSGDKLLGGPQAGLVVGRRALVERLRRAPLYRALRADKLALAALEATLEHYARGDAVPAVPPLRMISLKKEILAERARAFLLRLRAAADRHGFAIQMIEGESAVGGGAAPTAELPTVLVALTHPSFGVNVLEEALRGGSPPVVARIAGDKLLLDLRTVAETEEDELLAGLLSALGPAGSVKT